MSNNCSGDRGDAMHTLRIGFGPWMASFAAGVPEGVHAQVQWRAAHEVHETIKHIYCYVSTDQWVREKAADILTKAGPNGQMGALGQLHGHLFERLDILDYNHFRPSGCYLKPAPKHLTPLFDAVRHDANDKVVDYVQHKCGPANIPQYIKKLDGAPALAKKMKIRVPKDRLTDCKNAARDKITVEPSRLSKETVVDYANRGLHELEANGQRAASLGRQAVKAGGKAAGKGAVVAVAVGGAVDAFALRRGNLNARQFVARRGVDAAQGGLTAAATAATVTVVGATTGAVAAAPVLVPAAAGLAVGYGVSKAANPIRRYVTDRLQSKEATLLSGGPGSTL